MPAREKGEPLSEFIGRYMGSKKAKKDFPKEKQRLAVAYSEAREGAKRK